MFLDEYEKYKSMYVKGAKKVCVRSLYLYVDRKSITPTNGNYDLFFNKNGLLLHSVIREKRANFRIMYGYEKGILLHAMQFTLEDNELESISEFIYDEQGRIETERCSSIFYKLCVQETTERVYSYGIMTAEISMTSDSSEIEYTTYLTFDNKKRVIEKKEIYNEEELICWNRNDYDEADNIIREISLDENGSQDGIYEFYSKKDGRETGYKFISNGKITLTEYVYVLNEKGHWINQTILNEGVPGYICDRTIEYY